MHVPSRSLASVMLAGALGAAWPGTAAAPGPRPGLTAAPPAPCAAPPEARDALRDDAAFLRRQAAHGRAVLFVDVRRCRFRLYDARHTLRRRGWCSTGRGDSLVAPDGTTWRFVTPRGVRRVHHKAERPVWRKPDWAYVEEGAAVPPADDPGRLLRGYLGRWALDIGGGYLVHGSPYARGLGTRSTHGCIRLGENDLEAVYRTLRIGDLVVLEER